RQIVDQLRQDGRELAEQFLLAHAGAPGKLVQYVAAEGAAELAGLDRLVLTGTDPRIDMLAGAAGGQFPDQAAETVEDAGARDVGRTGRRRGRRGGRSWRRAAAEKLTENQRADGDGDRRRQIAAGNRVLHGVVQNSHRFLLNDLDRVPSRRPADRGSGREKMGRHYRLAFSASIPQQSPGPPGGSCRIRG